MLFGWPLMTSLFVTFAITYALLMLQRGGFRPMEIVIGGFVTIIGLCYVVELLIAPPDWGAVAFHSVVPQLAGPESVTMSSARHSTTTRPPGTSTT